MGSINGKVKRSLEYITKDRYWIEPSSSKQEVLAVIRKLIPVQITRPLIRIGAEKDGGYLVPDDLSEIQAAISPGVSSEVGFDLAMAERGIDVFMADASVAGPPIQNPRFKFVKKYVDVFEDNENMRLETLCGLAGCQDTKDLILQMDIEGAEYRVLLDLSDTTLKRLRIIVVEFHDLDRLFSQFPMQMIRATFERMLRNHSVAHIHPNNVAEPRTRGAIEIPPVMEFTFYRKDRLEIDSQKSFTYPHHLDADNVPSRPTVVLPYCWRRQ